MRKERTSERYPQIFIVFFLFIIALIPRLIWLTHVPTGISNDELDYVVNAKSLFLTGRGLTGILSPIQISSTFPNAELISVIIAPFIGPFRFSLLAARFPFAIIGAFSVLLLYLLTKKLIGHKEAVAVGLVACINPWNVYFSRTMYDAPVTTFFLLLGFYFVLSQKRWLILSAIIPFLLAFHTYMGMMIIFPFFLIIALYFAYTDVKKNPYLKEYISVGLLCMLFVLRYMFMLPHMAGSARLNELALPNSPAVSIMTDTERRLSIITPIQNLLNNKLTSYVKIQTEKYFGAFSPSLLFIHGDTKRIFTLFEHGFFYPLDALFLLIGFGVLFASNKRIFTFLTALILIAPIPTLASNEVTSYASRSYLLQPMFLILIGAGIAYVYRTIRWKKMFIVCLFILYGVSLMNFASIYALRNPIANSESANFSAHIMTQYAYREIAAGRNVIVVADSPKTQFKQYTFYTNGFTIPNASAWANTYSKGQFQLGKFRASSCITSEDVTENTTVIIEGKPLCQTIPKVRRQFVIPLLADAGSVYEIYQGKTCSTQKLERFPHDILFSDLNIEKLSDERFCEKFIIEY